ncbi:MAG: peptide-methionine (S)-S-oxide reductase MsrA [Rickettsiales bacterium]
MLRSFIALILICFGSIAMAADTTATTKTALFGGGCFWCMQPSFDNTAGVTATSVGYAGGDAKTATYDQVSTGKTQHVEVIQITYDPAKVTYEKLLDIYLENIDPTDPEGQFADKGPQYQTAVYYADDTQKAAAEKALVALAPKFKPAPIAVKLKPLSPFYAAEDYHQKYYQKNAGHYNAYKVGSGRADYIEKTWGKK